MYLLARKWGGSIQIKSMRYFHCPGALGAYVQTDLTAETDHDLETFWYVWEVTPDHEPVLIKSHKWMGWRGLPVESDDIDEIRRQKNDLAQQYINLNAYSKKQDDRIRKQAAENTRLLEGQRK